MTIEKEPASTALNNPQVSQMTHPVQQSTSMSQPNEDSSTVQAATPRISTRLRWLVWIPAKDPGPPPDGGLQAWLAVLGTHLVVMNTWGVINSFGVFQTYYVDALQRPPSDISWIGSISIFCLFLIGIFSGALTDAGFFYPTAICGTCMIALGSLATSAATTYIQIFLAQGVCAGLGNGLLFCPALAIVSTYFSRRRSIAIGITACGTSTGGVLFPLLVRQLLPIIGFPWTIRTIGLIQVVALGIAVLCLKPRLPPRRTGSLLEWATFREVEYLTYALGSLTIFWGAYFGFFFIAAFSRDQLGLPYTESLDLLLIMNGVGTVGRLVPCYLADRVGGLNIFIPAALSGALVMYTWAAITSQTGLYVWAPFAGIATGSIQSMFPAALASLTTDLGKRGTRIGMVFTIVSFGVLTGPPIESALITALGGRYLGAQMFAGSSLFCGAILVFIAREIRRKGVHESFWGHL